MNAPPVQIFWPPREGAIQVPREESATQTELAGDFMSYLTEQLNQKD